jgi:hypothetical protein
VQGCPGLGRETSAGRRHVGVPCPAHEPNNRVTQRSHDLWDTATPYLGAIFIKGHIPDPMGWVFTVPLAADKGQQTRGVGTLWCQACDAGYHFLADLPGLFDDDLALQLKHLRQAWPLTIAREYGTGLQPALFDAAMPEVQCCCRRTVLSYPGGQGKDGLNVLS